MPTAADSGGGFSVVGGLAGFVFGTALSHILGPTHTGPPVVPWSSLPRATQLGIARWARGGLGFPVHASAGGGSAADYGTSSGSSSSANPRDRAKAQAEWEKLLARNVGGGKGPRRRFKNIGKGTKKAARATMAALETMAVEAGAIGTVGTIARGAIRAGGRLWLPAAIMAEIYSAVPSGGITPEEPIQWKKPPRKTPTKAPAIHGEAPAALPGGAEVRAAAHAAESAAKAAEAAAKIGRAHV